MEIRESDFFDNGAFDSQDDVVEAGGHAEADMLGDWEVCELIELIQGLDAEKYQLKEDSEVLTVGARFAIEQLTELRKEVNSKDEQIELLLEYKEKYEGLCE